MQRRQVSAAREQNRLRTKHYRKDNGVVEEFDSNKTGTERRWGVGSITLRSTAAAKQPREHIYCLESNEPG
jgi:hypothetical protein